MNIKGGLNIATLTVLKFNTPRGAEDALAVVEDLSKRQLITLQDAAIVSWPEGKKRSQRQAN
ncbi:hypothetical protein [Methanosarcina horonobensis]|uniref:hypothetical protein n=1 Tax=Methanosarcina horonobensis TaxID=418008 RepID=UPI000A96883D|nr:hypothetical protein [Methanosarcina horonobensis]